MKSLNSLIVKIFNVRTISRLTLDRQLKKIFPELKKGVILDVGAKNAPYRNLLKYKKYMTLDINPKHKPDIVCDVHKIKSKASSFDVVIATETLEHCYSPQKAVDELHRVLKKGGVCILSTRFIKTYHDEIDYYRYTNLALKHLFKEFKSVRVQPLGNLFGAVWDILSEQIKPLMLMNHYIINFIKDSNKNPGGYLVYAVK